MNWEAIATELQHVHGIYFFGTGIWPILHMRSFLAVTGPKQDLWLVRTVGALIAVIGVALFFARETPFILAIGSSVSLAFVDVYYVARRVIAKVYLLDAVPEIV